MRHLRPNIIFVPSHHFSNLSWDSVLVLTLFCHEVFLMPPKWAGHTLSSNTLYLLFPLFWTLFPHSLFSFRSLLKCHLLREAPQPFSPRCPPLPLPNTDIYYLFPILMFLFSIYHHLMYCMGFPGSSVVKNLPEMQGIWVWSLGQEDPLEKEVETHPSILA